MAQSVGLQKLADDLATRIVDEVSTAYEHYAPGDTPIEKLFSTGLLLEFDSRKIEWWILYDADDAKYGIPKRIHVLVEAQKVLINNWPVDFYISTHNKDGSVSRIIVECDGHDFHERTKEQAARDRSRDRRLQALGHIVFRFTGSEIYRDPLGCSYEVIKQLYVFWHGRDGT